MALEEESENRWALILRALHEMAGDKSLPASQRARYRAIEISWGKVSPREREAQMDAFLKQLEADVVADYATGREQLASQWPPRGPRGALPVPDDTPWAPPRRRRKA